MESSALTESQNSPSCEHEIGGRKIPTVVGRTFVCELEKIFLFFWRNCGLIEAIIDDGVATVTIIGEWVTQIGDCGYSTKYWWTIIDPCLQDHLLVV